MSLFVLGVAASVTASAVVYLATDFLSPSLRLIVMVLLLALGIVTAWFASHSDRAGANGETKIGRRIATRKDVSVENVEVKGAGSTEIGTHLKADGDVQIRDVRVARDGDSQ